MSSPSQPISIRSPRPQEPAEGAPASFVPSSLGTPNLNALRGPFIGTPQVPNIPPRSSTPLQRGSPALGSIPLNEPSPRRLPISPPFVGSLPQSIRAGILATGGSPGPLLPPSLEFEGLTDEDKARVLRRHLVSKEERLGTPKPEKAASIAPSELEVPYQHHLNQPEAGPSSRRSSDGTPQPFIHGEEDTDPFPIPYHAPGADVT
jgi:proton-coupled amino acid transporter